MTAISFSTPAVPTTFIRQVMVILRMVAITTGLLASTTGGIWYSVGQIEEHSAQMDSPQ